MRTFTRTRPWIVTALIVWIAACSSDDERVLQLSYESIPGVGVTLDEIAIDTSAATYDDKQQFTQQVFDQLIPDVMAAVGVDVAATDSEITPGGYLLETNPAMQTRLALADAEVDRLAAALGYVMYQWSVLVADFSSAGDTGYATVVFSDGDLTGASAQAFFAHAATVEPGLGGGYSAFGDEMIFLNLRDAGGAPYSGLDDDAFIAALEQAATSFAGNRVALAESGAIVARLVENDWDTATAGEQYLALAGDPAPSALEAARAEFNQLLADAAATHGWEVSAGAPVGRTDGQLQRGRWGRAARIEWPRGAERPAAPGEAYRPHIGDDGQEFARR